MMYGFFEDNFRLSEAKDAQKATKGDKIRHFQLIENNARQQLS
jgi:hypothetical protein